MSWKEKGLDPQNLTDVHPPGDRVNSTHVRTSSCVYLSFSLSLILFRNLKGKFAVLLMVCSQVSLIFHCHHFPKLPRDIAEGAPSPHRERRLGPGPAKGTREGTAAPHGPLEGSCQSPASCCRWAAQVLLDAPDPVPTNRRSRVGAPIMSTRQPEWVNDKD